ncbi:MAG: hypothetical protein U0133_05515 [Gemmatimonadales bacterium]
MRMLGRTAMVLGLACLAQAPSLSAQSIIGFDSFKWYVGAQGGVTIFETTRQTRGGIFTAGGHMLVTARRTGLLLSVEEGIKKDQLSSYPDATALNGSRNVSFNDIRKYSVSILAFPFKTIAQPYLGIGFGILQTVKEYPTVAGLTPTQAEAVRSTAHQQGSSTFASFTGGVQIRVSQFAVFGQYQITTAPSSGHLLTGPTHALTAGLRVSLGSSREDEVGH